MARPPWLDRLFALPELGPEGISLDDRIKAHLLIEKLEPGLREAAVPDNASQAIEFIRLRLKQAAGGGDAAGTAGDQSGQLVSQMINSLPALGALPRNAQELRALLTDRTNLSIPVTDIFVSELSGQDMSLLRPVAGYHWAIAAFSRLLQQPFAHAGNELKTTVTVYNMFFEIFRILETYSGIGLGIRLHLNRTEKATGSRSSAVTAHDRPDTIVVYNSATLMIGEDKADSLMLEAINDVQSYVKGGLGAGQYGSVPGIPGYAASGLQLQFCYISRAGQVSCAGLPLDLDTTGGRLHAVCYIIQCYRLLAKIVSMLPPVHLRLPLWGWQGRGKGSASNPWSCEVMITPQHVFKTISQFSNFCRDAGTSKQLLERAYGAAKAAAEHQAQMRKKPFLACAAKGPAFKSGGFSVRIVPVGYNREVSTEMDARRMAWSCVMSAKVLHAAGIVHSDFRLRNVVWLDEEHCMVIDLEHCKSATEPLPDGCAELSGWTADTLEKRHGKSYFTPASDLYQIGRMLQQLMTDDWSDTGRSFVDMLHSKSAPQQQAAQRGRKRKRAAPLTADAVLAHEWLQQV